MLGAPALPIGLHQGGDVGLGHEAHDDDAERDQNAAADVLLGLVGFLGQGGDAVEADRR